MGQENEEKRELVSFTRDIHKDQLEKMKQIQKDTRVPVADQVREALDKSLLLGAHKPR